MRTMPVTTAPKALIARDVIIRRRLLGVGLGAEQAVPVPDHAGLADRERHEDADDVELDQRGHRGVVGVDQQARHGAEDDDPVAEREPVAARVELAGQVAVLREHGAEYREAVERGVGGEGQDQRRHHRDVREAGREVAEHRAGDLGDRPGPGRRRPCRLQSNRWVSERRVGELGLGDVGERDDAAEHRGRDHAEHQQGGRGVLALGLAEGRDAVADRLDPGQRGAAGGERPQQQEDEREAADADLAALDRQVQRSRRGDGRRARGGRTPTAAWRTRRT